MVRVTFKTNHMRIDDSLSNWKTATGECDEFGDDIWFLESNYQCKKIEIGYVSAHGEGHENGKGSGRGMLITAGNRDGIGGTMGIITF